MLNSILFKPSRGQSKESSRVFVALFDYDPPTMSPNPEACDDELSFSEGQLIKVNSQSYNYYLTTSFSNGNKTCPKDAIDLLYTI